jgi:hypothetical protein
MYTRRLQSYGTFRVGDTAEIFGAHVRILGFRQIPGGVCVDVERISPGRFANHWTDAACNLQPVDDGEQEHECVSQHTPDGCGAFCATCGETLA